NVPQLPRTPQGTMPPQSNVTPQLTMPPQGPAPSPAPPPVLITEPTQLLAPQPQGTPLNLVPPPAPPAGPAPAPGNRVPTIIPPPRSQNTDSGVTGVSWHSVEPPSPTAVELRPTEGNLPPLPQTPPVPQTDVAPNALPPGLPQMSVPMEAAPSAAQP